MAKLNINFITEIRTLSGMFKDMLAGALGKFRLPDDKYIDAENIRLSDPAAANLGGASLTTGNELKFDLGFQTDEDYKAYRIELDITIDSVPHEITVDGTPYSFSGTGATKALRYASLVAALEAATTGITGDVYIPALSTIPDIVHVGFKFSGGDLILTEEVNSTAVDVQVIHEYLGDSTGAYVRLWSSNEGNKNNLFTLKTNGSVLAIDAAVKNDSTGDWTNVTVFKTKQIVYATDQINLVDFVYELNFGDRCSFYYSGTPPRTTYIKLQTTWTEQNAFIWNENPAFIEDGNPDGYYTFENVALATQRQITENTAYISDIVVNDSGGSLTTGNKYYFIRQLIGVTTKTPFGLASNPVSIFQSSLTDTRLYGNVGGEQTAKSVTLTISGLNTLLYDSFELGYVENIDGVLSQWVITTKYPIGTASVTHTGFEPKASLTTADLLVQQVYLTSTGNEVINDNRLFSSDVKIQLTPPELAAFSKTCLTITTGRKSIPAIGEEHFSVNEYQKPENIFESTGYMLNETYRFGIVWKHVNGFTYEACFSQDFTFSYATGELTDTGIPDNVYTFFADCAVDLTGAPDIDGKPFAEVIKGYSIVRRPCIPEILATGYFLPASFFGSVEPYYVVGGSVSAGVPYVAGATTDERRTGAFVAVDAMFRQVSIIAQPQDQLLVYGQPFNYNNLTESRTYPGVPNIDYCTLREYNGDFQTTYTTFNINPPSEFVEFNSSGGLFINGLRYLSTVFNGYDGATQLNNMDTQGIALGIDSYAVKKTAHTDYGFYYAQYYSEKSGKYGGDAEGNYQSCGHYQELDGNTTYNNDVFGGDTFTQKMFQKFCTYYDNLPNNYERTGISYYSQNRANEQLRYFTDITRNNLDYPYTTNSLVEWLSGDGVTAATAGRAQLNEGQLNYSVSYTPVAPVQVFPAFNSQLPVTANQPSTMYYSEPKIDGSLLDPYTIVLPLNNRIYTSSGRITNTFKLRNALALMCENEILIQQINQQQTQTDPNGTDLILGNGTVLGARTEQISFFGSPLKTGALQYIVHGGSSFFVWYNPYTNNVYRRGGDGIRNLVEENFISTFMTVNNQFVMAENSVLFGWDGFSHELLMRMKADIPGSVVYDGSNYSAGQIVAYEQPIGLDGVTTFSRYFKARIDVPGDTDPTIITNQLNYWEIYRNSNYLLAFNEKDQINDYSSFYNYPADGFIPYKDTFLTNTVLYLITDAPLVSGMYEHNKNTLKYCADGDGNGGLDIKGYVTLRFEKSPEITKALRNVWIRAKNMTLTDIHFRSTNGRTRTFSVQADIVEKRPDEQAWFSNVKNDATIGGAVIPTGTNTDGSNELCTQWVEGQTNEVTVFFTNDDNTRIGNINEVLLNGIPRPTYYNT